MLHASSPQADSRRKHRALPRISLAPRTTIAPAAGAVSEHGLAPIRRRGRWRACCGMPRARWRHATPPDRPDGPCTTPSCAATSCSISAYRGTARTDSAQWSQRHTEARPPLGCGERQPVEHLFGGRGVEPGRSRSGVAVSCGGQPRARACLVCDRPSAHQQQRHLHGIGVGRCSGNGLRFESRQDLRR